MENTPWCPKNRKPNQSKLFPHGVGSDEDLKIFPIFGVLCLKFNSHVCIIFGLEKQMFVNRPFLPLRHWIYIGVDSFAIFFLKFYSVFRLLHGLVKVVKWKVCISCPLPNKTKLKISNLVEAFALSLSCWVGQSTQCLRSFVHLVMFIFGTLNWHWRWLFHNIFSQILFFIQIVTIFSHIFVPLWPS